MNFLKYTIYAYIYSQTHNEIVFIQYDSLRPYLKYDNITDIQTQGYVDAINSRLNYLL